MLLNANEAFGPKGWIKTLDLTNILNNQQFRKEDCIAVPNTIAIIKGEKSILNKQDDFDAITRRVISLVNNNNFKVAKHLDEKGILGVIYIGHFTAKGHFLMLGKGNVDYRSIYPNAISYHIAAFIGLGCTSSRHDWYKATARGLVWSTNYKINLNNLANVPLTEIYPDGAIFPEDGNYVPPARLLDYYTGSTGKKGISLQKFIETFAHHIADR